MNGNLGMNTMCALWIIFIRMLVAFGTKNIGNAFITLCFPSMHMLITFIGIITGANALIQLNTITLRTLCKAKGIDTTNLKKQAMVDALTSDGKTKKPKRKKSRQKSNNRGGGKENKRGGGNANKRANRRNVSIQEPPENDALVAHKCKDNVRKKKKSNKQEEDASSDESSVDLFQYDNVYFGELDELAEEVNQKEGCDIISVSVIKMIKKQWIKRDDLEKMVLADDGKLYSLMQLPIGVVQAFARHFNKGNGTQKVHNARNDQESKSNGDETDLIRFSSIEEEGEWKHNYVAFEAYLYEDKYSDLKVFGTKNDYHDAKLGRNTKLVIVIGRMTHSERWKSWVECVYTIKQFMVEYKKQRKVEKARYPKLYGKKYYIRSNSNYTKSLPHWRLILLAPDRYEEIINDPGIKDKNNWFDLAKNECRKECEDIYHDNRNELANYMFKFSNDFVTDWEKCFGDVWDGIKRSIQAQDTSAKNQRPQ
eukprot:660240_1